jgi:cell division protein FtsL
MTQSDLVTLVSPEKPARKSDLTALTLFIAIGFAVAITGGVTLSGAAMGTLQQALRALDFGRDAREAAATVAREQRRQAQSIGKLERVLDNVVAEIATLNSRVDVASSVPARSDVASADIGKLNATIGKQNLEIGALRSSITEHEKSRRDDVATINKRLDRLETLMTGTGHDLTGSIRPKPLRPRVQRAVTNWSVDWGGAEGAVVSGNGETHAVSAGSVLPGLGRVSSVRQRGDRWIVVTEKGVIAQRNGLFAD